MVEDQVALEPGATAERTARWEDYVDVFLSPVALFRRRASDKVGPPLITLILLGLFFYFIMLPANRMVMLATVGDDAQALEAMERMGTVFQVVGSIFVPISYVVTIVLAGFVLMLVGRLAELPTTFSRTLLIATYAAFVYLLAQVAGGVSVLLFGGDTLDIVRDVSFGPLRFLGDSAMSRITIALLQRFEIFTLWQAVLWGIGIAVVYRASRAQAATVAALSWLLLTIPALLLAASGIGRGG